MINEAQQWGDFSEWLDRINQCIDREAKQVSSTGQKTDGSQSIMKNLVVVLNQWVQRLEDAPTTTWNEELEVRGFEFPCAAELSDSDLNNKLEVLLNCLANMNVFFNNTDHLSNRDFYQILRDDLIQQPIAQLSATYNSACLIDVVGLEIQENPVSWLQYYATNRERMEWAKQNPGKILPAPQRAPYSREKILPKP